MDISPLPMAIISIGVEVELVWLDMDWILRGVDLGLYGREGRTHLGDDGDRNINIFTNGNTRKLICGVGETRKRQPK